MLLCCWVSLRCKSWREISVSSDRNVDFYDCTRQVFGTFLFFELSSLVFLETPSSSRITSGRPVEMSHCGAERGANYVSNPGDLDGQDGLM